MKQIIGALGLEMLQEHFRLWAKCLTLSRSDMGMVLYKRL
jgi:hypothetical protein